MLFATHILLGISLFLLFADFFNGSSQIIFLSLVMLGSILPDIDSSHSKINRWSGIIGIIITFFSKHRGLFHSLLFQGILFVVVSYFFSIKYAQALFLGYLAHVIGDGLTVKGLYLFYPFSQINIRGPIKVGGFIEKIIFLVLVIVIVKQVL